MARAINSEVKAGRGTPHGGVFLDIASRRPADYIQKRLPSMYHQFKELAEVDVRKSQVVEMRYFGGLTVEETAEALKVSPETVMRDWKLAKAWLLRELAPDRAKGEGRRAKS